MKSSPKICVPICAPDLDQFAESWRRAGAFGQLIELRLDCLPDLASVQQALDLICGSERPVIITMRSSEEGGHNNFSYVERKEFWTLHASSPGSALLDLELDLVND